MRKNGALINHQYSNLFSSTYFYHNIFFSYFIYNIVYCHLLYSISPFYNKCMYVQSYMLKNGVDFVLEINRSNNKYKWVTVSVLLTKNEIINISLYVLISSATRC